MDFTTFLNHFDTIAQAPNGIAKLRSLILDLAVRGKLVPQDPEDQSATEILKQVQEIRKAKKIASKKSGELNIPENWSLPTGWVWTCLQELGEINPRNDLPDGLEVGFVPMTLIPTDYRQNVDYEERKWSEIKKGFTHFANGDVGVAKITPCFQNRKSVVFSNLPNQYGAGTTELLIFRSLLEAIDPQYVLIFLKTPSFVDEGVLRMTGTAGQQRVPRDYFAGCAFPLPPLAEQKRIVEKVDELMALCDRYQQSQEAQDKLRQKLRESAIASLMNAETDEELQKSWSIVRDNWRSLSQKPEDVADLRRSILQLAVKGKLTFQSVDDEPIEALLTEAKQYQPRYKPGEKDFVADTINDSHFTFYELPNNWKWVRLRDLSSSMTNGLYKPASFYSDEGIASIRMFNIQNGHLLLNQLKRLKVTDEEYSTYQLTYGDIVVNRVNSRELVGKAAIVDVVNEPMVYEAMNIRVRLIPGITFPDYINLILLSEGSRKLFFNVAKQASGQASISQPQVGSLPIPCPPLAEQKRIVVKVDELMQMCDRLEESLRQSQQRVEALAASAISHLTV